MGVSAKSCCGFFVRRAQHSCAGEMTSDEPPSAQNPQAQLLRNSTRKFTPPKEDSVLLEPFIGLTLAHIFVPATEAEFAAATAEIMTAGVVGFDTESKPVFDRGVASDGPHVAQFSLADRAYIFQLCRPDCRRFLIDILQAENVLKVGFGLSSDHAQIRATLGVKPAAVLDLDVVFRKLGHRGDTGARAGVHLVLNQYFRKSKAVSTTNWAQPTLSPKQLLYAANDAYVPHCVLMALDLDVVRDLLPVPGSRLTRSAD